MYLRHSLPALVLAVVAAAACSDSSRTITEPSHIQPSAQLSPSRSSALSNIPVSGTQTVNGVTTPFSGLLNITSIALNSAGQLVGSGTITDLSGNFIATFTDIPLTLVGTGSGASCPILQLDIGAIHLNLLGLVLDISPIQIDLTAQQGPGNLLGNLLCAVAHLLDSGNLAGIQNLLDQINAIL